MTTLNITESKHISIVNNQGPRLLHEGGMSGSQLIRSRAFLVFQTVHIVNTISLSINSIFELLLTSITLIKAIKQRSDNLFLEYPLI